MMQWMRGFTIRLRMQGAIAAVLGLFALLGLTTYVGYSRLTEVNATLMSHSVKELHDVSNIRTALGQVRQFEKNMVINHASPDTMAARWKMTSGLSRTSVSACPGADRSLTCV